MSEEIKAPRMKDLDSLSVEELSQMQEEIRKAKKRLYRHKGVLLGGYLTEEFKPFLPLVMQFLKDSGRIEKNNIYNLTSYSVRIVTAEIIRQIKERKEQRIPTRTS